MSAQADNQIRISVRALVEFLCRSGDIDLRAGAGKVTEAMQAGSRLHRKIQGQQNLLYQAEVPLSEDVLLPESGGLVLTLEGRADGIYQIPGGLPGNQDLWVIDEIKCMYRDVQTLEEPVPVHEAQAKCYAFIWMRQKHLRRIGVQMTYCQMETESLHVFRKIYIRKELESWFTALLNEYRKWAVLLSGERAAFLRSVSGLEFPFAYRPGQRDMVAAVYRSIVRKKNLFVQAATGVGKTMSTVFPAIRAMGEGYGEKLFYLTARNVTRVVAEESLRILRGQGLHFSAVTLTAKEKICPLGKPECRPDLCPYANGHFDRVNDALYELLTSEQEIRQGQLLVMAEKYQVCPFELALDATSFTDGVLCDYNYAFDPDVRLKRFFAEGSAGRYLFLVDEAHNLAERARDMYSATLVKEDFLTVKRQMKTVSKKLERQLDRCNKVLLEYKRECEKVLVLSDIGPLYLALTMLFAEMEEFGAEHGGFDPGEDYRNLFFAIRHFLNMYSEIGDDYRIYAEHTGEGKFNLTLYCAHPARHLKKCLEKSRQTVFFSATLLPVTYYKDLLGGEEEDYAIYVPSPFPEENRRIVICRDVSSRYRQRTPAMYRRIAKELLLMTEGKKGHYLAFFPSYAFLRQVLACLEETVGSAEDAIVLPDGTELKFRERERQAGTDLSLCVQKESMTETEKEAFLEEFRSASPEKSMLGLCVLGGSFSEGIDLKGEHLIGCAVVGVGLPQVCTEREILQDFYRERSEVALAASSEGFVLASMSSGKEGSALASPAAGKAIAPGQTGLAKRNGYDYAYRFPGMNKVQQAAGRVIRTMTDRGVILLMDDRFMDQEVQDLFPREWKHFCVADERSLRQALQDFWQQ